MRNYFCGWYFKCQSESQTMAIIPALHKSKQKKSCSIQLITEKNAWMIDLPYHSFHKEKSGLHVNIGDNYLGEYGIRLQLNTPEVQASGTIDFGALSTIRYDIMGPFCYVPFMECRHSIISMKHKINGSLRINGTDYRFDNGLGYIEGDRGYSFPKRYAWTHSFFDDGSLMLSIADIPMGCFNFTGIICIINRHGKEYRLATYLGAKFEKIQDGEIVIRQGNLKFSARLIEKNSYPLSAPVKGSMNRTIHESASCRARYILQQSNKVLFDFETSKASFEYEYS